MPINKIEIEIRAEAPADIVKTLKKLGAKKIREYSQLDKYYMFREGFIFRVRNNRLFTIKCNIDNRDNGWYEWESEIKEAAKLQDILLKCGFKLFGIIDKKRQQYKYGEFEVNIDTVRGLGKFIEIEILRHDKDEGLRKIKTLMRQIGIKKLINKGYINIVREKMHAKR
jgi:predicted adenylyl cyclase CyaB